MQAIYAFEEILHREKKRAVRIRGGCGEELATRIVERNQMFRTDRLGRDAKPEFGIGLDEVQEAIFDPSNPERIFDRVANMRAEKRVHVPAQCDSFFFG